MRTLRRFRVGSWSGRRVLTRAGLAVLVLCIGSGVLGSAQARVAVDIKGTWVCCGAGGAAAQNFVLTSGSGALAGRGELPGGSVFAKITGSVAGSKVTIVTTYNSMAPGYVATFVGTLSPDGDKMSGTWTSNQNQSGTWTATLKDSGGKEISGRVVSTKCGASACSEKGLKGVTVSASGGAGGAKEATTGADGTYTIKVKKGSWTVKPALADHEFDPVSRTVKIEDDDVSGVDFSTCAATRTTSSVGRAQKGPFCRLLDVDQNRPTSKDATLNKFPVALRYRGSGWDPKGGPIKVTWSGKTAKTFPAGDTFKADLYASEWPQRNRKGCWGILAATQSGLTRPVRIDSEAVADVLFTDNDLAFRAGDRVCKGEDFTLEHTRGTVIVYLGGQMYVYQADGTFLDGVGFPAEGKKFCLTLVPKSRGHVNISQQPGGKIGVERLGGGCS